MCIKSMKIGPTFMIALLWSCATADKLMFATPPGAESPRHVVVGPDAEQDYFWLTATYPATPALAHYEKVFAAWTECKPWATGWEGYGDLASGDPRYVHRFTRNWISRDNKQAVTVLFQYQSMGAGHKERPDNDRQSVSVIDYRVPDAAAFFAEMKVTCPK